MHAHTHPFKFLFEDTLMKAVSLYFYLDSEKFKYYMIIIFMIEN